MVAAAAIAASSALPPARSAATPEAEARECGEATMPRGARDSGHRVICKGWDASVIIVAGSVRSWRQIMDLSPRPTRGSALEVLAVATRLGLTSFGGPI